jgi:DedD protein
MEYTFTVRRSTGLALLAGLAVCFGLVFLAGWMVGLNSQMAQLATDTTAASTQESAEMRTSSPQENVASPPPDTMRTAEGDPSADAGTPDPDDASPDTTAPAPASSSTDARPAETAPFALQIGGFSDRANAQQVARRVRADGETVVVRSEQREGRTLHTVLVGRYDTRAAATRRTDAMDDYTGNAFVVRVQETAP